MIKKILTAALLFLGLLLYGVVVSYPY